MNKIIAKQCFLQGIITPRVVSLYDPTVEDEEFEREDLMRIANDEDKLTKEDKRLNKLELDEIFRQARHITAIRKFVNNVMQVEFKMYPPRESVNKLVMQFVNGRRIEDSIKELMDEVVIDYPHKPMWIDTLDDVSQSFEGYRSVVLREVESSSLSVVIKDKIKTYVKDLKLVEIQRRQIGLESLLVGFKRIQMAISYLMYPIIQRRLMVFGANLKIMMESKNDFLDYENIEMRKQCERAFTNVSPEVQKVLASYHGALIGDRGKGFHTQIDPDLYDQLSGVGYVAEGFSGPYNHVLPIYYSQCPLDRYLGSRGSFFSHNKFKEKMLVNPPFDFYLINQMFQHIRKAEGVFLIFLPRKEDIQILIDYYDDIINYKRIIDKENLLFQQFWEMGCQIGDSKRFEPVNDIYVLGVNLEDILEVDRIITHYEGVKKK